MNVFVEITKSLQARPNPSALVNFRSRRTLTSHDLLDAVDTLAKRLSSHLPDEKSVVGICLPNGEDTIIAVLALWQLGHAAMPLPMTLPVTEIENIMARGPAAFLIYSPLKDLGPHVFLPPYALRRFREERPHSFPIDDLAFVRFTSGTTEQARAVLISHQAILARAESFSHALGLKPGMTVLWHLDMSYHFTTSIVSFLKHGCTIHLGSTLLPDTFARWMSDHRVDLFFSLPFFYEQLAQMKTGLSIEQTQLFVTGQSIDSDTALLFRQHHGRSIQRMYGVIEAGIPALLGKSDDPRVIGPIARPFEIRIGSPTADGKGQIEIKSPGSFSGYLTGDDYQYEKFDGGWFNTGDLGYLNEENELVLVGRTKELILLHGHKFFPSEIESAVNSMPGVTASAAFMAGDPPVLKVAYASEREIPSSEIKERLRQSLEHAKIPDEFIWVLKIPTTHSGKILRHPSAYPGWS